MERLLQSFREYPAVIGISVFVLVSLVLTMLLGTLMHRAGVSLKPLVFFLGFLAIVGVPQGTIHLLDAWAHHRSRSTSPDSTDRTPPNTGHLDGQIPPIPWETVFGPNADPSLITDAKRGLDAILSEATDAKLSFNVAGESALAARFKNATAATEALNRYGTFFQFAQASGSDSSGWTAKRHNGQGEWAHVIAAQNELYAWTGATRESVLANRTRALGPIRDIFSDPTRSTDPSKTRVSNRLSKNLPVMVTFLGINVVLAVGWFFKASAWSTRIAPTGAQPVDAATLRSLLLAMAPPDSPITVQAAPDGQTLEVSWRYGDARWLDLMRVHRLHRAHKLVLELDAAQRKVRVREFMSAFDASAGADGLRFAWNVSRGMQFFQIEHQRNFGVQLRRDGMPTGDLSNAYTFDLQELKAPAIEAITGAGWIWQPVMWSAPAAFRWLTE
jgi:hypothetical protein